MKKWTIGNTETCQHLDRMLHRVVLTKYCPFKEVKKLKAEEVEELQHYFTDKYINSIKVIQTK